MKVKVLIEGYAKEVNGEEFASSSTVLIEDGVNNIIVDPGSNRSLLLEKLNLEGLTIEDISMVLLTHNHLDHSLLTGMFSNALVYDDSSISSMDSKIINHSGFIGENIEIISTPGHDQFHMSVLVKNTSQGNVVISGDIFWWEDETEQETDYESLINLEDPYVKNQEQLLNSRKAILEIADYIIPGHGKPFRVSK
jgi:glyoxylase-like metal-dependent hydrolase (beta-lactamase superfamily II)